MILIFISVLFSPQSLDYATVYENGAAGAKIKNKKKSKLVWLFVNFCLETENGANLRLPFFFQNQVTVKKKQTPKLQ